jgi:hypothetical protein
MAQRQVGTIHQSSNHGADCAKRGHNDGLSLLRRSTAQDFARHRSAKALEPPLALRFGQFEYVKKIRGGMRLTASLIALKAFLGLLARQALPIVPQQIHHLMPETAVRTRPKWARPADVCALNPLESGFS